ncbi:MAG: hypothetical protein RTU30_13950 [Candidatus Thorarchaeota archaeon]
MTKNPRLARVNSTFTKRADDQTISYRIIDWSKTSLDHIAAFTFAIPAILVHSVVLVAFCSLLEGLLRVGLFVLTQILIGLPLARFCYTLGTKTKSDMLFQDSESLTSDWVLVEEQLSLGDVSLVFEKLQIEIHNFGKSGTDDLNDLVWFAIVVWAMMSVAIEAFIGPSMLLCISPSVVLALLCVLVYKNGYSLHPGWYMDELIDHLEYHTCSRFRVFNSLETFGNRASSIYWKQHRRTRVLHDFMDTLNVKSEKHEGSLGIRHDYGLPSTHTERIVVSISKGLGPMMKLDLTDLPIVKNYKWVVQLNETDSESEIVLENSESSIDMSKLDTLLSTPSETDAMSKALSESLHQIVKGFL